MDPRIVAAVEVDEEAAAEAEDQVADQVGVEEVEGEEEGKVVGIPGEGLVKRLAMIILIRKM